MPGPMTGPVDGATLTMSERQGIEIDYCPTSRGVRLARGELDKIIERANDAAPPAPQPPRPPAAPQQPWSVQSGYPRQGDYGHQRLHHGKRKKSFLEDLFD